MVIKFYGPNEGGEYLFRFEKSKDEGWTMCGTVDDFNRLDLKVMKKMIPQVDRLLAREARAIKLSQGRKIWQYLSYNGFIDKGVEVELEEEK